jgi:hypothetical protein
MIAGLLVMFVLNSSEDNTSLESRLSKVAAEDADYSDFIASEGPESESEFSLYWTYFLESRFHPLSLPGLQDSGNKEIRPIKLALIQNLAKQLWMAKSAEVLEDRLERIQSAYAKVIQGPQLPKLERSRGGIRIRIPEIPQDIWDLLDQELKKEFRRIISKAKNWKAIATNENAEGQSVTVYQASIQPSLQSRRPEADPISRSKQTAFYLLGYPTIQSLAHLSSLLSKRYSGQYILHLALKKPNVSLSEIAMPSFDSGFLLKNIRFMHSKSKISEGTAK